MLRKYILFLTLLTWPAYVQARDTGLSGINLEFYHPSIDPSGTFGLNGPAMLPSGKFYFKMGHSYAAKALLQTAINGAVVNLVDSVWTADFLASVGLNDAVTMALDMPYHPYAKEADFNTLQTFHTSSIGDLRLYFKFKLLEEGDRRPGAALLFYNEFPTGDENKFLGVGKLGLGFDLIAGKKFRHVGLTANAGAKILRQKILLGTSFDDRITYGAAVEIPVDFAPGLSALAEIRGHFEPGDIQIMKAPVEYTAGFQKKFDNGFLINVGAGGALNNAVGNPTFRGLLSIGYSPGGVMIGAGPKQTARHLLYYAPGQWRQFNKAIPPFSKTVAWLKKHPHKKIKVEGYTDSRGTGESNLRLSKLRAERVKNRLVKSGINPHRIKIKYWGDQKPAATNKTKEGQRLNRRVEIR